MLLALAFSLKVFNLFNQLIIMENYLSIEFRLEKEKRYLQQNPRIAIAIKILLVKSSHLS